MATPDVARAIPADELRTIDVPENYLGVAETLRVQLLDCRLEPEPGTSEPDLNPEP